MLRTSAPYSRQANAVAEILEVYDWKYVGVVYSGTPYGRSNYEEFKMAARAAGICLAAEYHIDQGTDFDKVISNLSGDSYLNVIVAFVEQTDARKLLFADEFDRSKRFTWVGTDTWDSPSVVARLEETASGMLFVANKKPDLPELQDHFSNLDLQSASLRDPFFGDYLKENYNCDPSATDCQFDETLIESIMGLSGEISALVNALDVVAQGASWLRDDKCGSAATNLCDEFLTADPEEMIEAMQRVTLESGAGGEMFAFDGRSSPAVYDIKNFQFDGLSGQFVIVSNGMLS